MESGIRPVGYFFSALIMSCALIAGFGFGCSDRKQPSPSQITGPKPATFENLSPAQAAEKINFVQSNVMVMKQEFTGAGAAMAHSLGWGDRGVREIVIRRFAPGVRADIEWKLTTQTQAPDRKAPGKTSTTTRQFVGSVVDADLLGAHSLSPPSYWVEGEISAMKTGILWLSQDVYENLVKTNNSTFDFGLLDDLQMTRVTTSTSHPLSKGVVKLRNEVASIIARTDVFLTMSEPELAEWKLKVNGQDMMVQVIKAKNWFGEMVVLNNKQNPLVLKVETDRLAGGALDGFFDYEIVELREIQE